MGHGLDGGWDPELGRDTRDVERMIADEGLERSAPAFVASPCPVSRRVRRVVQPDGGFLPVSLFRRVPLGDPTPLRPGENLPAPLVGVVVDYLSRVAMGQDPSAAFRVPLSGAGLVGMGDEARGLLARIVGFDRRSVEAACVLCSWDEASRGGPERWRPLPRERLLPDAATVWNIRRMVARTLGFLESYGPVVWEGFTFEGGYTDLVTSGAGDFLTRDALWDMKCSRHNPNPVWTLQLLVYWLMGLHSVHTVYRDVRRLGLFNPRLDAAWIIDVDRMDAGMVGRVEREVVGYGRPDDSAPPPAGRP